MGIEEGRRRAAGWIALVAVVLAAGEAGSAVFFHLRKDRFAWADASAYTREIPDTLASMFDAELGWTRGYATPFGERPRATDRRRPWLAAFGDSFVHGDEVEDGETWEEALAGRAGADVLNFGVSGYGPDQALLMFRRQRSVVARGRVAVLGTGLENVNRIVNRYRPFYARSTGIPLPKPRFVLRNHRLELLPNPVQRAEDLRRLADPGFVDQVGQGDYWYAGRDRPRFGFPYLRLLFSPRIWTQARSGSARLGDEAPAEVVWAQPEPRQLFMAILDAFAQEARAAGVTPVFVLNPGASAVLTLLRHEALPGNRLIERRCRELEMPFFDGQAPLAADVARTGRSVGRYFMPGGHPSPLGHAVMAEALEGFLAAQGLGPTPAPAARP